MPNAKLASRLAFRILPALLLATGHADAAPVLSLSSGGTTIVLADQTVLDTSPIVGVTTFLGSLNGFDVEVTAEAKPAIGSPNSPQLAISSISATSLFGGQLLIFVTDTDFSVADVTDATLSIAGSTDGTAFANAYFDAGNAAFGTTSLLTTQGPLSGPFADTQIIAFGPLSPFSLTYRVDVFLGPGESADFAAGLEIGDTMNVPEPASLALLFAGLLGGAASRRRTAERCHPGDSADRKH